MAKDPNPKLIIVTGRPGSGKTTLATELGKFLYLPVLSRDEIKEGYINTFNVKHDQLPPDTNKKANDIFFGNIEFLLSNHVSLIAEAAFQHAVWKPELTKFAKYAAVFVVLCEIDAEVAARRHLERGISDPKREFFHGDNRVSHFRNTGVVLPAGKYEPLSMDFPTIRVSTSKDYDPALANICDQLLSFLADAK